MTHRFVGPWVLCAQRLGGFDVPTRQLPPASLQLSERAFWLTEAIGDARSRGLEESTGGLEVDDSVILTADGRVWESDWRGRLQVEHSGGMHSSFERATPESWRRALERQLRTLPGVGASAAGVAASSAEFLSLASIRAWSVDDAHAVASAAGVRPALLMTLVEAVQALRVAQFPV